MLTAGKWALCIVTGGLTMGALLGDAVDPRMKDPVPQWWQLTGRDEIVPSSQYAFFEASPEDLSPYDGFRPDLDYDAEVWALPIPAYELAILEEPAMPSFEDELPRVTYGAEAAQAADEAEAAADDALAAETQSAAELEPAEVSKPELTVAGLY